MTVRKRVGVLISGRGSNLASLIQASRDPGYPVEIVLVLSNKADAYGLVRAKEADIPTRVISHKSFPSREDFDAVITSALKEARVDLVCNAGFMRLHSASFVREWCGRQLNIHPSLLPAFRGLHPHARALEAGVRVSGATVHFVSEEMDAGPIIAQGVVPVEAGDTEDALAARILAMEHRLYPLALKLVASGAAWLENGRVEFAGDGVSLSLWPQL
jgi:phosphoribosylglycinamide formyltransferase-1